MGKSRPVHYCSWISGKYIYHMQLWRCREDGQWIEYSMPNQISVLLPMVQLYKGAGGVTLKPVIKVRVSMVLLLHNSYLRENS